MEQATSFVLFGSLSILRFSKEQYGICLPLAVDLYIVRASCSITWKIITDQRIRVIVSMILIIPCFNEAERLNVDSYRQFSLKHPDVELLFVNDGSTDATAQVIASLAESNPSRISCLHLPQNRGKAEAVRHGVLKAVNTNTQMIGYWDADLATPLSALLQFAQCINEDPLRKMVCGARVQRMGAKIQRHWYRHYPGRIIATIVSIILDLPFYDTQCGAKLFDNALARQLFEEPFISPWLFDVELIARIVVLYGKQDASRMIFELPLECWIDRGNSKIAFNYLPKIPFELFKIFQKYRMVENEHSP